MNLNNNSISDAGASRLSQALKVNSSLTDLTLYGNSIGDAGAFALSHALAVNSSLSDLNLNANSIGDAATGKMSREGCWYFLSFPGPHKTVSVTLRQIL